MRSALQTLDAVLARRGRAPQALLQILREVQETTHWLPLPLLSNVAGALRLPLAQVRGVAGFYRFLHTVPVGDYRILFSDNITDRMLGFARLRASASTAQAQFLAA